jgi:hypothetical protein
MQLPPILELLLPQTTVHGGSTTLPTQTLRLPAAAWSALPSAPAIADSTRVSETLGTLSLLLDRAFREPPRPFPLMIQTSLASAAPPRFAAKLASAVSGSGVFFEAHLAEWVRGERGIDSVRAEADARTAMNAPATDAAQRTVPAGEAALQQQLSLLVTSELAFQFSAWPGQAASLAIEQAPDEDGNQAAPEREFVARLDTELRALGAVHATLHLSSYGIDLALRADSPQTAALMREGLASLAQAFIAAGLRVGRIEVQDEQPA